MDIRMNSIGVYLIGISLLISGFDCHSEHPILEAKISEIANGKGLINGVLKPLEGGKLCDGDFGLVWRGTVNRIDVAIKFGSNGNNHFVEREYKMYAKMNAIDNATAELYSIPAVYYRGMVFQMYDTIATTLCEMPIDKKIRTGTKLTSVDVLLIFQKVVRALKFIHSKGVLHNDINPTNILLKGAEVYVSDFNEAELIGVRHESYGKAYKYLSINGHNGKERFPADDFESLFYTILELAGVELPWSFLPIGGIPLFYKDNYERMLALCDEIEDENVGQLFKSFYRHIMCGIKMPSYDGISNRVTEVIAEIKKSKEQAYFSWLRLEQINQAKKLPTIEEIDNPPQLDESFTVPTVSIPRYPNQYTIASLASEPSTVNSNSAKKKRDIFKNLFRGSSKKADTKAKNKIQGVKGGA